MAIYGVAITKKVTFRLAPQEFSNVYHYSTSGVLGGADAESLIDQLKTIETSLHAADVTFVRGRVWTSGGSPASNVMVKEKALSGTGNQINDSSMDRERAVLAQWPAGVNNRGRPVYLRKWYHSCGAVAGVTWGSSIHANTGPISDPNRATIAAQVDNVEDITAGAHNLTLVAKSGRTRTGPLAIYKWLEHHQLGDQWRG